MPDDAPPTSNPSEVIVRQISKNHRALYRFIFSLVPNDGDANDILQETCLALYRKANSFDPDKGFLPWAFQFAKLEVLSFRRRAGKSHLLFDMEMIEKLASQAQRLDSNLEREFEALDSCLRQLPAEDLALIEARYFSPAPFEEFIEDLDISRRTAFRQLDRVRQMLLDCIHSKLEMDPEFPEVAQR